MYFLNFMKLNDTKRRKPAWQGQNGKEKEGSRLSLNARWAGMKECILNQTQQNTPETANLVRD